MSVTGEALGETGRKPPSVSALPTWASLAPEVMRYKGDNRARSIVKTGSLTSGKQADLILLRRDKINVMPINDPVGAVVYGMDTSNVDSVYVGGRARKQAGQLVGADPARSAEQAIASRAYLASKVAN
jgi:hypothetical protein